MLVKLALCFPFKENLKNPSPEPYPVPKEVWLLVDNLYRHGIKTKQLFESRGYHTEIIAIRDWLDEGSQDPMRILNYYKMSKFRRLSSKYTG